MQNKLQVLAILDRLIPSNIIGIIRPFLSMQKQGEIEFRLAYTRFYKEKDIMKADVIVLCRNIRPEDLKIIYYVKKHGKKLIYDIDDNFFELSTETPLGRYHRHPGHLYVVRTMIRYADCIRVYSEPMREIAEQINPDNVVKVKSYFDLSMLDKIKPKVHDKIKIVYATSRGNADPLANICVSAIKNILQKYPEQVEYYAFGFIPEALKGFKNVFKLNYIYNYAEFIRFFYEQGFDIGLAPGIDDRFHNSKTNNKFREYGAMQVCGIYSDIQIYRDCVQDHSNGIIVQNTTESWTQAISELVEKKKLRETIKKNARKTVQEEYSLENTLRDWRNIIACEQIGINQYHLICAQKIAVIIDEGKNEFQTLRLNSLFELLGFYGINYKIFDITTGNLKKLSDYNIKICSFPNQKVARYVTELKNYGVVDGLIIDTYLPFEDADKFEQIVFTNTAMENDHCYSIQDSYRIDAGQIDRLANEKMFENSHKPFERIRMDYQNMFKQERDYHYSLDSPMAQWAMVIERYSLDVAPSSVPLCSRITRKLFEPCRKVIHIGKNVLNKLVSPFKIRFYRVRDRVVYLHCILEDYIRINIFKDY